MDTQEKLFALMAIAEEHQAAVMAAVAGLAAERDKLDATRAVVSKQLREITRAAEEASGAVQKAAKAALDDALARTINLTAGEVTRAINKAVEPTMTQLNGVVTRTAEADLKIRGALVWFSWRWLVMIAAASAGVLLMFWLEGMVAAVWQEHEIKQLVAQRDALVAEVAELQAGAEAWKKKAGRAKLETCGDQKRLCVRVDPRIGYGEQRDYFVLRGY